MSAFGFETKLTTIDFLSALATLESLPRLDRDSCQAGAEKKQGGWFRDRGYL